MATHRESWDDCIAESGLEDGKYVCQDEDWEPPYLDTGGVCDDLEQIAHGMRDVLDRVWDEGLDPDFSFARAIEEAAEAIGAGLDVADVVEPPHFGRESTACLLVARVHDARDLLRAVRERRGRMSAVVNRQPDSPDHFSPTPLPW